jgi:mevalonate kinase
MEVVSATAQAPGKAILFGEHAVVYGEPAIAVPVRQLRATATVEPADPGSGLTLRAPDLGRTMELRTAPPDEPLALAARLTLTHLGVDEPDALLSVRSQLPIAGGLGSGAAVSVALIRALARALSHPLAPDAVSRLAFEVEKLHHGTPSGIDNTTIAYEQPVYFVRGRPIERLALGAPLTLVIADSGAPSPTKELVTQVRRARRGQPATYDALLTHVGALVRRARAAMERGDAPRLGALMDENQQLLGALGVSSPLLEGLVEAARRAGARGAKLSGAGRGGNVIALVEPAGAGAVSAALAEAGAARVIRTVIPAS